MRSPRPHIRRRRSIDRRSPSSALAPLAAASLTAGLLVGGLMVAPATAGVRLTITSVDVPAPGRLHVEVATSAPSVLVQVTQDSFQPAAAGASVTEGGRASADLETWGLGDPAQVRVYACSDVEGTECRFGPATASVEVQDVEPRISWPEDAAIGTDDPPYQVEVADPDGGGRLQIVALTRVRSELLPAVWLPVERDGVSTLDLPDGRYTLRPIRCAESYAACHQLDGPSRDVVVRRGIAGRLAVRHDRARPSIQRLDLEVPDDITSLDVDLQVRDRAGRVVAGVGGKRRLTPRQGYATTTIDLRRLRSGRFTIGAASVYTDPEVGPVTITFPRQPITIDSVGPRGLRVRFLQTTLEKSFQGEVELLVDTKVAPTDASDTHVRYEIRDGRGRTVLNRLTTPGRWMWDGRSQAGRPVPPGRYTVTVVVFDGVGNEVRARPRTIVVREAR